MLLFAGVFFVFLLLLVSRFALREFIRSGDIVFLGWAIVFFVLGLIVMGVQITTAMH